MIDSLRWWSININNNDLKAIMQWLEGRFELNSMTEEFVSFICHFFCYFVRKRRKNHEIPSDFILESDMNHMIMQMNKSKAIFNMMRRSNNIYFDVYEYVETKCKPYTQLTLLKVAAPSQNPFKLNLIYWFVCFWFRHSQRATEKKRKKKIISHETSVKNKRSVLCDSG